MKFQLNKSFSPSGKFKLIALIPLVFLFIAFLVGAIIWTHYLWLPVGFMFCLILFRYLILSSIHYTVDENVIKIQTGLFNKDINFIRLERIIDVKIMMPFIYSISGLYFLHIYSIDKLNPHFVMMGLTEQSFVDNLNVLVDKARARSRIIETV